MHSVLFLVVNYIDDQEAIKSLIRTSPLCMNLVKEYLTEIEGSVDFNLALFCPNLTKARLKSTLISNLSLLGDRLHNYFDVPTIPIASRYITTTIVPSFIIYGYVLTAMKGIVTNMFEPNIRPVFSYDSTNKVIVIDRSMYKELCLFICLKEKGKCSIVVTDTSGRWNMGTNICHSIDVGKYDLHDFLPCSNRIIIKRDLLSEIIQDGFLLGYLRGRSLRILIRYKKIDISLDDTDWYRFEIGDKSFNDPVEKRTVIHLISQK